MSTFDFTRRPVVTLIICFTVHLISSSKAFNFIESTPLSEVGTLIEEAFWTCNKNMSIDILSSRGVMPSSSVRVSVEDLGFVERIPTLPTELVGFGLLKRLREYGVITDITIADLKSELEQKALNASQLVSPANTRMAVSVTLIQVATLSRMDWQQSSQ